MKRVSLSVLTFMLIIGGVNAQDVSFGLKGGLNFANQDIDDLGIESKSLVRYHVGFYVTSMLSSQVGIQFEALYSGQGSENSSVTAGIKYTDKYEYINFPVLFRVDVVPMINLQFGPQLGLCFNATRTEGNITSDSRNVKTLDFAVVVGAGFDVGSFNGGLRYNIGLTDVNKVIVTNNNVIQIYIGVRIMKG